jgi:hypothetical protein
VREVPSAGFIESEMPPITILPPLGFREAIKI